MKYKSVEFDFSNFQVKKEWKTIIQYYLYDMLREVRRV